MEQRPWYCYWQVPEALTPGMVASALEEAAGSQQRWKVRA